MHEWLGLYHEPLDLVNVRKLFCASIRTRMGNAHFINPRQTLLIQKSTNRLLNPETVVRNRECELCDNFAGSFELFRWWAISGLSSRTESTLHLRKGLANHLRSEPCRSSYGFLLHLCSTISIEYHTWRGVHPSADR